MKQVVIYIVGMIFININGRAVVSIITKPNSNRHGGGVYGTRC